MSCIVPDFNENTPRISLVSIILDIFFAGGKIGIGEGNGNPLQYSCLENPMDGGGW